MTTQEHGPNTAGAERRGRIAAAIAVVVGACCGGGQTWWLIDKAGYIPVLAKEWREAIAFSLIPAFGSSVAWYLLISLGFVRHAAAALFVTIFVPFAVLLLTCGASINNLLYGGPYSLSGVWLTGVAVAIGVPWEKQDDR